MSRIIKLASTVGEALGKFEKSYRMAAGRNGPTRGELVSSLGSNGVVSLHTDYDGQTNYAQRRAMLSSWVFANIGMIARAFVTAPVQIVRKGGPDDEPEQIHNHPLERLFRNPNPDMSGDFFWQYLVMWAAIDGNAYVYIRTDQGRVLELWPLPSNDVTPRMGQGKESDSLVGFYEFRSSRGVWPFSPDTICHFKYIPDPWDITRGLSPLRALTLSVDTDLAMAKYNAAFFGKGNVSPQTIVNISGNDYRPLDDKDVQALKDDLRRNFTASDRRTALVSAVKLDVARLGLSQEEMDFIDGRNFSRDEIAYVFGIPEGIMSRDANRANSGNARDTFKENTIYPLHTSFASEITRAVVERYYNHRYSLTAQGMVVSERVDNLEAEFEDIRPRNRELELMEMQAGAGVLTVDEVRQTYYQRGPLPNGKGQVLWGAPAPALPSFAAVPDFLSDGTGTVDVEPRLLEDKAVKAVPRPFRPWQTFENNLLEALLALAEPELRRIVTALQERGATLETAAAQDLWLLYEARLAETIGDTLEPLALFAVEKARALLPRTEIDLVNWDLVNQSAADWARRRAAEAATSVTSTSRQRVRDAIADHIESGEALDDLVQKIGSIIDNPSRAEAVAVTETTNAFAQANSQAWQAAGYAPAFYTPSAHVNCRCWIQPKILSNGDKVIVWNTAEDELVCTTPLSTPFGEVRGCRELNGRIVSGGEYLGREYHSIKSVKADTRHKVPEGARGNAQQVLDWREKYGDDVVGMTAVGWRRARQLATDEYISYDIVARMSAFNRHKSNYEKARRKQEKEGGNPWEYAAIVAWLGWGGDTGINWARRITGAIED